MHIYYLLQRYIHIYIYYAHKKERKRERKGKRHSPTIIHTQKHKCDHKNKLSITTSAITQTKQKYAYTKNPNQTNIYSTNKKHDTSEKHKTTQRQ